MGDCHKDPGIKQSFASQLRSTQTFYEVLEVPPDASKIQIREAYVRLKTTYSNGSQALYSLISDDDAKETLERLEEAYRVLYDEILRKDYDQNLSGGTVSTGLGNRDPFHSSFQEGTIEYSGPESEETEEDTWPINSVAKKKPVETANKKRFSGQALDSTIQDKIKSRLETDSIDGTVIKDLREIQGVTLNELQDRTKVSLQYIIALENNDFQTLPSLVYVKGFLKICLQYLGVQDGIEVIINKYLESVKNWQESKGIEQY